MYSIDLHPRAGYTSKRVGTTRIITDVIGGKPIVTIYKSVGTVITDNLSVASLDKVAIASNATRCDLRVALGKSSCSSNSNH
jgi:hypothetical protein